MSQEELAAPPVEADAPETQTEPETQQPTDTYESAAREQGWKPKEEYEGDPDKWRPAKEFVERGELFGKIDNMGKELKETRKALKLLQEHHTKVKETEYNRAVAELKALQKQHLESGDSDAYLNTTEILTDLRAEQKAREVIKQQQPQQPDERFVAWTQENKWYNSDPDMKEYADTLGMGYAQRNPSLDPGEVLEYVTAQVKARFKDKFVNPNRNKPSSVEGASTPGAKRGSFELTEDERRVMNTFVRTGVMTKEAYIDEIKKMRG